MSRAPNEVVPGPTGRRVVENVARLRTARGLTREALAERLSAVGRPIRATGLARLEAGKRRVDADDLVALALALDVAPVALLLPPVDDEPVVGLTDEYGATWVQVWQWATGDAPLDEREPAELFRWLRANRPHDDAALYAARLAVLEQTPGVTIERDECGRVTAISGPGQGVRRLPDGSVEEFDRVRYSHDPELLSKFLRANPPKLPPLPPGGSP